MADPAAVRVSDEDAAQRRAQLAERRRELRTQLRQEASGGLVLVGVCVAFWATGGGGGYFWPGWVAAVVLLPLIRTGWRLYGPAPDRERVEHDLADFRRRREREPRGLRRRGR